jgi:hypothetical protein
MTAILGYCDSISAAPGETVRFMASCHGADACEVGVVRPVNPEAGPQATPFRTEPVAAEANRTCPGRSQTIHAGSHELVAEEVRVPRGATNAVQNPAIDADLVFFETDGGGAVLSTGSIAYAGSLAWNRFDNNVARLTANVLRRFADPESFEMPGG